jgi:hypothetical protein
LADGGDADPGEPRLRGGTHAPHQFDWQLVKEIEFSLWIDDDQSIRLGHLRRDLGQVLSACHADGHRQAKFGAHAGPNRLRNRRRRTEKMRASCDVGEGLIDRDALYGRREITQHSDGRVAQPLVFVEVSGDENEVGTELPRAPPRHAASHAQSPRFVGSREHDSAADRNRPAA